MRSREELPIGEQKEDPAPAPLVVPIQKKKLSPFQLQLTKRVAQQKPLITFSKKQPEHVWVEKPYDKHFSFMKDLLKKYNWDLPTLVNVDIPLGDVSKNPKLIMKEKNLKDTVIKLDKQINFALAAEEKQLEADGHEVVYHVSCLSVVGVIANNQHYYFISLSGEENKAYSQTLKRVIMDISKLFDEKIYLLPMPSNQFKYFVHSVARTIEIKFDVRKNCAELGYLSFLASQFDKRPDSFYVKGIVNLGLRIPCNKANVRKVEGGIEQRLLAYSISSEFPAKKWINEDKKEVNRWFCCENCWTNKNTYLLILKSMQVSATLRKQQTLIPPPLQNHSSNGLNFFMLNEPQQNRREQENIRLILREWDELKDRIGFYLLKHKTGSSAHARVQGSNLEKCLNSLRERVTQCEEYNDGNLLEIMNVYQLWLSLNLSLISRAELVEKRIKIQNALKPITVNEEKKKINALLTKNTQSIRAIEAKMVATHDKLELLGEDTSKIKNKVQKFISTAKAREEVFQQRTALSM